MERVFTQTFGVVGGLLVKDGKFLLVKESDGKGADGGKWSQPAGWIDVGEDVLAAAKREVEEETGYEFAPTYLLGIYSIVRNDLAEILGATPHAIKLIFIGNISDKPTKELYGDTSEVKWFSAEEIEEMSPSDLRDLDIKQIVKDYLSGKKYPLEIIRHSVSE
ncbi:MAG: NUDIX domain-containing protein [Candidatus Paceibacterota bacterium]|jgi:8-oxo-dGTP pyrophosphatase MutT (NUDIX family)